MNKPTPPRQEPGRECGDCAMCCHLLSIDSIQVPADTRCPHQTATSCTIYADRPDECRDFECLWLQGHVPWNLKPMNVRAVLYGVTVNGDRGTEVPMIVVHQRPGAKLQARLKRWVLEQSDRIPVCVQNGGKFHVWLKGQQFGPWKDGQQFMLAKNERTGEWAVAPSNLIPTSQED